ncbi:hypothetical protein JW877_08400, partial [bacterium]|nr:hypothetical protein [bacterium]
MPKLMIRFINIFFLIIVSFRLVAPETVWLGSGSTTPVERLPLTNIEGEFPEFSRAEQSIQNKEIFSPAEVLDSLEVRVVVPPGRAFAVVIDPS